MRQHGVNLRNGGFSLYNF